MGGGGGNTQTQKSEPSDFIKPYLTPGMDEAKSLFGEGPAKFYEGSTVPTGILSAIQSMGMGGQQARAGSQYAVDQMAGGNLMDLPAINNLRSLGGSNAYAGNPAVNNLSGMANAGPGTADRLLGRTGDIVATGGNVGGFTDSRVGDLSTGGPGTLQQFRSDTGDIISGRAQALNPAMMGLLGTSSGAYLNSNPYLDQSFNQAADAVTRQYRTGTTPGIEGRFALSSGAAGSGAAANARDQAQENYGKTLGSLATSLYGGAYDAERARQEAATANLGSLYQSGLGLRASTAGTAAGQGTADAQTRLAATGQISNDLAGDAARRLQASGMLQGAEQSDAAQKLQANQQLSSAYESGADRQLQSLIAGNNAYNAGRGQQLQALGLQPQYQQMGYNDLNAALGAAQTGINADISRWDYEQNAPWQNVQRYLSLVAGGSPGQSTSITNQGGSGLGTLFSGLGGLGQLALATKGLF